MKRWRTALASLLVGLASLADGPAAQAAGDAARLQIVAHPQVARLVIEAAPLPSARLEVEDRIAHLRFDRSLRLVVPPIPAAARAWLDAIELSPDGTVLALALAPNVVGSGPSLHQSRLVVDLVAADRSSDPAKVEPALEPTGPSSPPASGAQIRIRIGRHPTFQRIVLEGSAAPALNVRTTAGGLEISGREDLLRSIEQVLRPLGPVVVGTQPRGTMLAIALAEGVRPVLRTGRRDQIVIDLVPAAAGGAPASAGRGGVPASTAEIVRQQPSEQPRARSAEDRGAAAGASSGCPPSGAPDALCVLARSTGEGQEIVLQLVPRPAAAVFARAGAVWVVLDRPVGPIDVMGLPDPPVAGQLLRSIRREPHPEATLLRLDVPGPVVVTAEPVPEGWRLRLAAAGTARGEAEAPIRRLVDPPAIAIGVPGKIVRLPAALVGSEIAVLPTDAGPLRAGPRSLVDLEMLATEQGVAWRPVSDDLWAREAEGQTIFARPGGLRLDLAPGPPTPATRPEPPGPPADRRGSIDPNPENATPPRREEPPARAGPPNPPAPEAVVPKPATSGHAAARPLPAQPSPPLLPGSRPDPGPSPSLEPVPAPSPASQRPAEAPIGLAGLRPDRDGALETVLATLGAPEAGAGSSERALMARRRARLELARGRAAEALAALGEPSAASDPQAEPPADLPTRALSAVAAALLERRQAAERLLDEPRLAGDPEVALWRGVLAGQRRDWQRAAQALAASGRTFQGYPPVLQRRLAPLVARILVEVGRTGPAFAVLDLARRAGADPRERARLLLVEGLGLLRDRALDRAEASLRAAAEGEDPAAAIEARYHLARLEGERGRLGPEELVSELLRQRLLWRDHPAEPVMLEGLSEALAAAGRAGAALAVGREMLARYPGSPEAARLSVRTREILAKLLAGEDASSSHPIAALRLARAHPELVPEGAAGAAPLRTLARRLATAGLPGVAANLLTEKVLPGLGGAERADAVVEIAGYRLRSGEPGAVVSLLDAEREALAASAEATQKAALLRAEAVGSGADSGGAGPSGTGARERIEAAWQERDWVSVADLGRHLRATGGIGAGERGLVLRVATAMAIMGEIDEARALLLTKGSPDPDAPETRLLSLLADRPTLQGDPLEVAAALEDEIKQLRTGLGRSP